MFEDQRQLQFDEKERVLGSRPGPRDQHFKPEEKPVLKGQSRNRDEAAEKKRFREKVFLSLEGKNLEGATKRG